MGTSRRRFSREFKLEAVRMVAGLRAQQSPCRIRISKDLDSGGLGFSGPRGPDIHAARCRKAPHMNELESFLHQTAAILGQPAAITEFGVSRTLTVDLDQRLIEVGTNGPMLWLNASLDWPAIPSDGTFIGWAPENGYLRTKLIEGPGRAGTTGDVDFDHTYLIFGPSAETIVGLDPQFRRLLLANETLRPQLLGRAISHDPIRWCKRRHIRCEPSLSGDTNNWAYVELWAERFKPEYAARWAEDLSTLAASLAAWSDVPQVDQDG